VLHVKCGNNMKMCCKGTILRNSVYLSGLRRIPEAGYIEQTKFLDRLSEETSLVLSYLQLLLVVCHIGLTRYTVIVNTTENQIFIG
jgi:hypothetical protein